jgi:agmatine deiminase
MRCLFYTLFSIGVVVMPLSGQQRDHLPRFYAPGEQSLSVPGERLGPLSANFITDPPSAPVRFMAEWEELQGISVVWRPETHHDILTEIIRAAKTECKVFVHCPSNAVVQQAKAYLAARSVAIDTAIEFLVAPSNSIWVRDYGASSVYQHEVDSLLLIDWIYNRPRFRDDTLGIALSKHLLLPIYTTAAPPYDLVNTGGNVMTDGMGLALSSKLVLEENGKEGVWGISKHTESEVDAIMKQFMGIRRYLKMETLPYDGIHHIDMHLKLLDENTLLVGEYPENTSDGPQIEANLQYLLEQLNRGGRTYRVIRIPMPPWQGQHPPFGGDPEKRYLYPTYANSIIINKSILIPTYGTDLDEQAKQVYATAMPGYKIVPIRCNNIIGEGGALHCIIKETGVKTPLRIVHWPQPAISLPDLTPAGWPVGALIQHRTGIQSANIYYTRNPASTDWSIAEMTRQPDSTDYWVGHVPSAQVQAAANDHLYYYIEATAYDGKKQVRPMPAPAGWWTIPVSTVSAVAEASAWQLKMPYPNPANGRTCIPVYMEAALEGVIRLLDATGNPVDTIYEGLLPAGVKNYFLDAGRYPAGIYFVALQSGGKTLARRLLIVK